MTLEDLLAVPYNREGDSPETGFNCYTLVSYVRKNFFDLPTPELVFDGFTPEQSGAVLKQQEPLWVVTQEPVPGDLMVMKHVSHFFWHHCGVVLSEGRVIHACNMNKGYGRILIQSAAAASRSFAEVCFAKWPV